MIVLPSTKGTVTTCQPRYYISTIYFSSLFIKQEIVCVRFPIWGQRSEVTNYFIATMDIVEWGIYYHPMKKWFAWRGYGLRGRMRINHH